MKCPFHHRGQSVLFAVTLQLENWSVERADCFVLPTTEIHAKMSFNIIKPHLQYEGHIHMANTPEPGNSITFAFI